MRTSKILLPLLASFAQAMIYKCETCVQIIYAIFKRTTQPHHGPETLLGDCAAHLIFDPAVGGKEGGWSSFPLKDCVPICYKPGAESCSVGKGWNFGVGPGWPSYMNEVQKLIVYYEAGQEPYFYEGGKPGQEAKIKGGEMKFEIDGGTCRVRLWGGDSIGQGDFGGAINNKDRCTCASVGVKQKCSEETRPVKD